MAIMRYDVSNDPNVYEAWPDLLLTKTNKLICMFCECTHHGLRTYSRIAFCESTDRGKTWTKKKYLTEATHSEDASVFWDCPRITQIRDGRLIALCNKTETIDGERCKNIYMWYSSDEGESWSEEINTGMVGIVPDKLLELKSGRWIISCHLGNIDGHKNLQQRMWYSDDKGESWNGPIVIGKDENLNLCEVSILEVNDNELVAFMRENSSMGYECYCAKSTDGGLTWGELYTIPLACCHRPVSGFLDTGEVMISYRYKQGAKRGWFGTWTQNTFIAITDKETVLSNTKERQWVRIMPLNYDQNDEADLGYTGWVQFDDGMIYIVDYIRGTEAKCHIIGASMYREDIGGMSPNLDDRS